VSRARGGWLIVAVTIFAVSILTEAAPAFLPLESWAPQAFAPPIFFSPTGGVEAAGNMPRGIVRSAQLSKRTKAGAAECRARVQEIKAGPAPGGTGVGLGGGSVGGGNGILPGEDCVGCWSLGPSPLQLLQDILSGNLLGALQGIGAFPGNGCDFGSVCAPMGSGFTPYNGPPLDPQSLHMAQLLNYIGDLEYPDYGPPILAYNPYIIPGTQCRAGCHPEPPQTEKDPYLCQNMALLTFVAGTAAFPGVSDEFAWFAYGTGAGTGAYGLFNCL